MFTVWRERGFTSRLWARFNQMKRNDMVESIQAITRLLVNLSLQHTNMRTDCLNWPTIYIGKEIYHPILNDEEIMQEIEERRYTDRVPWIWRSQTNGCAITSTGKILSKTVSRDDQRGLEIIKPNGSRSMFCGIPAENDGGIFNLICCFAVDENDNVYIVYEFFSRHGRKYVPTQYKLFTFDENGNAIADRAVDIIEEIRSPQMTVAKNGKLIIYCHRIESMYICDSTNAEKDYKFPLPLKNVHPDDIFDGSCTVSDQNEIIFTCSILSDDKSFVMYIITMSGKLKREVQVRTTTGCRVVSINVVFNHVNKTILVSFYNGERGISLVSFSKTGELLYKFQIPGWDYHELTSHPNGSIYLVASKKVMMLQM